MITNVQAACVPRFLDQQALSVGLEDVRRSPADGGLLVLIVARPESERRCLLEVGKLSAEEGLQGDRWQAASGIADPAVQITLMNARCIQLLTGDRQLWPLAGDNLFVDLDLSKENLPAGTRVKLGGCILEITEPPHLGCAKFKRRFGQA